MKRNDTNREFIKSHKEQLCGHVVSVAHTKIRIWDKEGVTQHTRFLGSIKSR